MVRCYAFLWHVNHENMRASEGTGGFYCESAETEKPTRKAVEKALKIWLDQRQQACNDAGCEHTPIITDELSPNMVKVQ